MQTFKSLFLFITSIKIIKKPNKNHLSYNEIKIMKNKMNQVFGRWQVSVWNAFETTQISHTAYRSFIEN